VWLHGMHIAPYEQGNVFNAEPRRKRKLLLHRDQINRLAGRVQQKGYTLVPLKFYFTRGKAKLELGVGKGRKTSISAVPSPTAKRAATCKKPSAKDVSVARF
jgi:SsrA-binding protein